MTRLSKPLDQIKDHYQVVVVGSGYGGGISASRMSRAGFEVCLLERGKEKQPGEYPDTVIGAAKEVQLDTPKGKTGSSTGMFNFHLNDEINVLVGCGLGGTSLINANVALKAEERVFEDPRWPEELRSDKDGLIEKYYERAKDMLKPMPYPDDYPELDKLCAHQASAEGMGKKFYRVPINVTFKDPPEGLNHVGVEQKACINCGDCVTGCNHKAKNTTLMNYLPDSVNHGAQIFTEASVRFLERDGKHWLVHCKFLGDGRTKFNGPDFIITADIVVLAAGTLGSTEILLRSKKKGLSLSERLGERFSGNGDVLGFAYNNDRVINGVGFGDRNPEGRKPVGPTITSIIDMRGQKKMEEGDVVEEGALPGAMSTILPAAMALAGEFVGTDTDEGLLDFAQETLRQIDSAVRGAYHGAMHNTQTFLVMGYDSAGGRMFLSPDDDLLRIEWPGVGEEPSYRRGSQKLYDATVPLGGTYVKNPIWTALFKHSLVTVHPLGGCVMADDSAGGVVNHKCQVFRGSQGKEVYKDLYVCDGAAIPCPLGVNPLLTISALTERACEYMAKDRGRKLNCDLPSAPPEPPVP